MLLIFYCIYLFIYLKASNNASELLIPFPTLHDELSFFVGIGTFAPIL